MSKRIKHNDLTHYFLADHKDLPGAYLASCEKFFRAGREDAEMYKRQATSYKRQATSLTDTDSGTIKDLESRKL
tara:strand:+ start:74 stop:295 length:222 start_codon:yes stop_codon:yes gene_type:complete